MPRHDRMDVSGVIGETARSAARFAATLTALTDTDVRAPPALPGWTRGHVATHVARSADTYVRLLTVARTGAEPTPRAGGRGTCPGRGALEPVPDRPHDRRLRPHLLGRLSGRTPDATLTTDRPLPDPPH